MCTFQFVPIVFPSPSTCYMERQTDGRTYRQTDRQSESDLKKVEKALLFEVEKQFTSQKQEIIHFAPRTDYSFLSLSLSIYLEIFLEVCTCQETNSSFKVIYFRRYDQKSRDYQICCCCAYCVVIVVVGPNSDLLSLLMSIANVPGRRRTWG